MHKKKHKKHSWDQGKNKENCKPLKNEEIIKLFTNYLIEQRHKSFRRQKSKIIRCYFDFEHLFFLSLKNASVYCKYKKKFQSLSKVKMFTKYMEFVFHSKKRSMIF